MPSSESMMSRFLWMIFTAQFIFHCSSFSLHRGYYTWRRQDACSLNELAKRRVYWMARRAVRSKMIRVTSGDQSGSSSFAVQASREARDSDDNKKTGKKKTHNVKMIWTPEEDMKLREAVAQYGQDDWSSVAAYVKSRGGWQCQQRWIYSLDPNNKLGGWTDEENALLKKAVEKCGVGNWVEVSQYMNNGKSRIACYQRWRYIEANENWTSKRDEDLVRLVRQYATKEAEARRQEQGGTEEERAMTGKDAWNKVYVGLNMGSSTVERAACRRRVEQLIAERGEELDDLDNYNLLPYSDSQGRRLPRSFSKEEDKILLEAVAEHGTRDWSKILVKLPGRISRDCHQRWRRINKNDKNTKTNWSKKEDVDLMKEVMLCNGWAEDSVGIGEGVKTNLPWNKIASKVGEGKKTGVECRKRWRKDLFRTVNPLPWTEQEDKALLDNVKEYYGLLRIFALFDLLHGRTEEAIIKRWEELTGNTYIRDFVPEEDEKLLKALRDCQVLRKRVSWLDAAKQVGSRSAEQCYHRLQNLAKTQYDKVADIMIDREVLFGERSDQFAKEEDEKLIKAVMDFQAVRKRVSWKEVASQVGNKSKEQCRSRYNYVVRKNPIEHTTDVRT